MPARPGPPSIAHTLSFPRRAAIVAGIVALNSALYLAINMWTPATAAVVPATALDRALGWHAWTIWPYALLLLLAPAMALAIREVPLFVATLRAYAVALALNVAIWLAYPTRLPRVSLPGDLDAATGAAWRLLHTLDGPGTCFPSGHITLPVVAAAGVAVQFPRAAPAVWLSIAVLAPSVITTGQHVALDIAGGVATALLGLVLTRHPLLRRPTGEVRPA